MITNISHPVKPTIASVSASEQQYVKIIEEIEAEFGIMVTRIQEALKKSKVDVSKLLIKLKSSSAARDREVPLFTEGIFEKITSIDKLFETLSGYWHLFDYDLLIYLVNTAECNEAKIIYDSFIAGLDSSVMSNYKLILRCDEFNKKGFLPGTHKLRVKVVQDKCTVEVEKEVKKVISKCFKLEKYALICKGIKEGCFELIYQISPSVKSYLLQYKFTEYEISQLRAHMITALKIDEVDVVSIDSVNISGMLFM